MTLSEWLELERWYFCLIKFHIKVDKLNFTGQSKKHRKYFQNWLFLKFYICRAYSFWNNYLNFCKHFTVQLWYRRKYPKLPKMKCKQISCFFDLIDFVQFYIATGTGGLANWRAVGLFIAITSDPMMQFKTKIHIYFRFPA